MSPASSTRTRTARRAAKVTRFTASGEPLRCDPASAEDHLRMALRRPQRRLPQVRPRRLSVHRHRRRQRHRRRAPDRPGHQRPARRPSCASTSTIPPTGKAYSIPKDNPFVDTKGARPEIWAYGLRQPWQFSFDRKTGDLWGGEVGQDLWEMVYKIAERRQLRLERQGGQRTRSGPNARRGPTPILPPDRRASALRFPLAHRRLRLSRQASAGAGRRLHLRRFRHRPGLGLPLRRQEGQRAPRAGQDAGIASSASARTTPASCTSSISSAARSIGSSPARRGQRERRLPAQAERNRPVRLDQGSTSRRRG